jgi:HEAT repeat protein
MMEAKKGSLDSVNEIQELIWQLTSGEQKQRKQARSSLIEIGHIAVPALIDLLHKPQKETRWEAANILGEIQDPIAIHPLITLLDDDVFEVRWRAAESLIKMKRDCIIPLLMELRINFDSPRIREGAHHILHKLDDLGYLGFPSEEVLKALENPDSDIHVPWAAEKALETLGFNYD